MKTCISLGLVVAALLFTACGKSGGTLTLTIDPPASTSSTDNPSSPAKPLFSIWTESNNYFQADLRSAQFGVSSNVTITAITAQTCSCKVLVQGGESSGTMAFSTCSGTYPDCGSFNISGNYTKSSSGLQLCTSASNCLNLK